MGVATTLTQLAKLLNVTGYSVHQCINGIQMTCKGFYIRCWDSSQISFSDLAQLNLFEYDALQENSGRQYYPTGKITRKGMKYKKHKRIHQKANF